MLKISIIIPVYKVQGFLQECLDSILASPYPHLEVIGVDDCSPDQSGEILARYAAADPRVRALRTPRNGGSGAARNLGFEIATGDYVWFADSDDLIVPGAIEQLVAKLETYEPGDRPDVLLFDYQRVTETGELAGSDLPGLLTAGEPPAAFTFTGWPRIAQYTHTTWNKVVRRDYLADLGLRFHPGWYQDVPWSYPLLINASHLALLNQPCYRYRQRRAGSVTRTVTDRHFEVFTQWERAWEHITETDDAVKAIVYNRMIWHCMQVLGNDGRITPRTRRRFFRHAAEVFHRRHPGRAYRKPRGGEGTKHVLLRRRWYGGYLATRLARRTYNRLRWGHPYGRYSSPGLFKAVKTRIHRLVKGITRPGGLYYLLHRLRSPQEDLVVFAGSSEAVAAMDAAVARLLPGHRRIRLTDAPRQGEATVPPGSAASYRALAHAKYVVTDHNLRGLTAKPAQAVHVRILPETPVEAVGLDRLRVRGRKAADVERWFAEADLWDFVVSPNRHASQIIDRAFQVQAEALEFGRLRPTGNRQAPDRRSLDIPADHRLVLYHPGARPPGIDQPEFDLPALERELPGATVWALDDRGQLSRCDGSGGTVTGPIPAGLDVAALYELADVVIGDYRGALIDRAVTGRPVISYLPDWDAVNATGHVTVDLLHDSPGPVARDWAALVAELRKPSAGFTPGTGFDHRFGDWTGHDAADQVVRRVFGLPPQPAIEPPPAMPKVTGLRVTPVGTAPGDHRPEHATA